MILAFSLLSLFAGTSLAYAAQRVPRHAAVFEQWGGTLFVSGLALLGAILPRVC